MRYLLAIPALLIALPVLLIFAIALGPVILAILCAAGFALLVFVIANVPVGLGLVGRSIRNAGSHNRRS